MKKRRYVYGPKGLCSTCGLTYFVRELRYVSRFGRWQCSECDDSNTPPDGYMFPRHPFEATRTTAAPVVDEYIPPTAGDDA